MLQILGVGFAAPKNRISNKLINELNPNFISSLFENETGITQRCTALNLGYLSQTKNADLTKALSNLDESDIDLASRAVSQALERSGLELSDIGLVIGETSTPFQTIPAQGQRIAGSLGLKVKAYDILAGAASPALHLSNILSWREERIPEYILLVYTNLPTVFIDYSTVAPSAAHFSDAAGAIVLAKSKRGSLSLVSAHSRSDTSMASSDSIEIAAPLQINSASEKLIESQIEETTRLVLKKYPRGPKRNYFIPSQTSPKSIKRLGEVLGFAGDEVLLNPLGDSFSCSSLGPLSERWGKFVPGDRVYISLCGLGFQFGHIVMEVN